MRLFNSKTRFVLKYLQAFLLSKMILISNQNVFVLSFSEHYKKRHHIDADRRVSHNNIDNHGFIREIQL